jgi:hypothetical protein
MNVNALPSMALLALGQALYVVAIIFALVTWNKHPRVSAVAAGACALAFMVNLVPAAYKLLAGTVGFDLNVYLLVHNVATFFMLIALALLLVAVFIDRGGSRPKPPMPDEDAPLSVPPRDDPRIRPS